MQQNVERGGSGFLGLLTVLFVALKLTGHISWSWWAVTSPLWAPLAVVTAVGIVVFLVCLAAELISRAFGGGK